MRILLTIKLVFAALLVGLVLFFEPFRIAFTVGTGIGMPSFQEKIFSLKKRAITNELTDVDKTFLRSFYRTLAVGASGLIILPESSRLMHRYLDGSGEQTSIKPSLFIDSIRVKKEMTRIRKVLVSDCNEGKSLKSKRFEMGHGKPWDAHLTLYFGTIMGTLKEGVITWEVNMPYKWPTFESLLATYGTYNKEEFPIPNMLSLISNYLPSSAKNLDLGRPLYLPNGLGGELEKQGLAKSFHTKTKWQEVIMC